MKCPYCGAKAGGVKCPVCRAALPKSEPVNKAKPIEQKEQPKDPKTKEEN